MVNIFTTKLRNKFIYITIWKEVKTSKLLLNNDIILNLNIYNYSYEKLTSTLKRIVV